MAGSIHFDYRHGYKPAALSCVPMVARGKCSPVSQPCGDSRDRALIEELVFDGTLEPSYEALKACLVWADECPDQISRHGYGLLCDLWIVRGLVHRGIAREHWGPGDRPAPHLEAVWDAARESKLRWPGFRRLELSLEDAALLDRWLEDGGL